MTDQSGAVVPAAVVTIINVDTKIETPTKTNGAGEFSAVGLNVGNYSVKVTLAGFETYEKENFYLGSTQTYTVNASLGSRAVRGASTDHRPGRCGLACGNQYQ